MSPQVWVTMTRVNRDVIIPQYKKVATTLVYDHGPHWHRKFIEVERPVLRGPGDPQFQLSFVAHSGSHERLSAIDNVKVSLGYCPRSGELSHRVHTHFNHFVLPFVNIYFSNVGIFPFRGSDLPSSPPSFTYLHPHLQRTPTAPPSTSPPSTTAFINPCLTIKTEVHLSAP